MPPRKYDPNSPFDHPMQQGWLDAGLDLALMVSSDQQKAFRRFGAEAQIVLAAVGSASRSTDNFRNTHERENVHKLLLGQAVFDEYLETAGDPDKLIEHVAWFGKAATKAYTYLSHAPHFAEHEHFLGGRDKIQKIALELGGRRQAGVWQRAREVDQRMRQLPKELSERLGAKVVVHDDPDRPEQLSHKFIRMYNPASRNAHEFEYGTVRRRRMIADIALKGTKATEPGPRVELFKESTGLVCLKYLTPDERAAIQDPYRDPEANNAARNSPPAVAAGGVFAQAIRNEAIRDRTLYSNELAKKAAPMSALYVMLVRGTPEFMGLLAQLDAEDAQS